MSFEPVAGEQEKRLSETEAAAYLGVKLWKLRELCRSADLPHGELSRKKYFYASHLEAWMRSRVKLPKAD